MHTLHNVHILHEIAMQGTYTFIHIFRTHIYLQPKDEVAHELSMQSTSACNICPLRRFPNLDAALWLGDNILVQEGERLQFQN